MGLLPPTMMPIKPHSVWNSATTPAMINSGINKSGSGIKEGGGGVGVKISHRSMSTQIDVDSVLK